ncbi:MAG: PKD domain-containing protein, partial [Bacteroidetes bacterium]|nr:PKD domain-containing protein [Bacteroidota bacterium]
MKNKCLLLLSLLIAFCISNAQQITFRTSYNIAALDIPGNIVQNPQKNYVMAGTNTTFIPLYGNVTQLDTIGNIMWSKGYQSGIATELLDIKNTTGGGYIVTGSTGSGALLMKLDAAGAVTWSYTYSYNSTAQESGNKVVQTSDGGYVVAGYVYDADPDGAGALARQDSANLFCMKADASGNLVWAKTFFVSTSYINDHALTDVAEVSDGYIFTGYSSDSNIDDDGNSAILVKTDKAAGTLLWARRYTAADDANAIVATSSTEVLVSGSKAGSGLSAGNLYYIRVTAAGALVSGSGNQYGFSGIGTAVIPDNVFLTNDGNYGFTGTYINPLNFLFGGYTLKINPSSPATPLFTKAYNAGFSTLFSKGLQAVDSGYISVSLAQQGTGFNYHVVKTDKNGNMNDASCDTIVLANPSRSTFTPTLNAMTLTELSGAPRTTVTITVANLAPTQTVECLVVPCTPPAAPTASASPTTICAGQSSTISGSGSGSNVTYRVYDAQTGGNLLGNAPLNVTPASTTTYWVDVQPNATPGCFSSRSSVTVTVNQAPSAVGTITGAQAPCPGSQNYSIAAVSGATSYTWSVSGGGSVTSQSGTAATINWTAAGTYIVSVTATNSCGSKVGTLSVNVQAGAPTTVGTVSGSTTPCPGVQNYSINPVTNATSYTWSVSGGGTIQGGQGTNAISVNWTTSGGPYTVSVTASNACGSTSGTTTVNVQQGAPAAPTTINGNNDICIGNQGYSVPSVSGATGYTWSTSGGGTVTAGQGTTSATINWTTGGTYTVSVVATNPCGNSAPTTLNVTVTATQPTNLGTITGTSPICSGVQTYSVGAATGGTSYAWTVGAPGTLQTGQGTTSITVNWPATAGTYPVT